MKNILLHAVFCAGIAVFLCACDSSASQRSAADGQSPAIAAVQPANVPPVQKYSLVYLDLDKVVIDEDGTIRPGESERLKRWNANKRRSGLPPSDRRIGFVDADDKLVSTLFPEDHYRREPRRGYSPVGEITDGVQIMKYSGGVAYSESYGIVNMKGDWIVKANYPEIKPFSEGLAVVCVSGSNRGRLGILRQGRYGFFDTKGKLVIPAAYTNAESFSEGLAAVQWPDGRWGYIDRAGKTVIPPQFHYAKPFADGVALAHDKKDGQAAWGVIGRDGNWILNPWETPYDVKSVAEGMVQINTRPAEGRRLYGYMDLQGNVIVEPQYAYVRDFSEGLAVVVIPDSEKYANIGKYAYIAKDGRFVTEAIFDDAWSFSDGMGRVLIDGKHGFVDRDGKLAIPPTFDGADDFRNGTASVYVNLPHSRTRWGHIDKQGNVTWDKPPDEE